MRTPRLRDLEFVPQQIDGRPAICLRDPLAISEHVAALAPPLAAFLSEVLDGTRTVEQIAAEAERVFGEPLDAAALVEQLDQALFLDSPRFRERHAEVLAEYRGLPARPSVMTGAWEKGLGDYLDGLADETESPFGPEPLAALAVPHLDLRFGGRAAMRALAGLADAFAGDTVVVLGVGHQLARRPFALTRQDFETPLGTVPAAGELFDRVVAAVGSWAVDEELTHRFEHSVEYAAALLRHALGERPFRILPVLCGSFHPTLLEGRAPGEDPLIDVFVETLAEEIGDDALVYASVDLDHRGPVYGDPNPLVPRDLDRLREQDERLLECLAGRDADALWAHLSEGGEERRVCGASALWTTLRLLPEDAKGSVLAYEQAVFPEPGNTVSICSFAWTRTESGVQMEG
jgi:AmmeMemoRadiSam system protein B